MIFDLQKKKKCTFAEYDICIIGSGPAGLTVANELRNTGLKICVLESGVLKKRQYADKLRDTTSTGISIKDCSRERVVGGASSTWSGLSGIFDPIDFKKRSWVSGSGWSFPYEELLKYYDRASEMYDFPHTSSFSIDAPKRRNLDDSKLSWGSIREKIFIALNKPQRFGLIFLNIFTEGNVDLFLNATVKILKKNHKEVTEAIVSTSSKKEFSIKSKVYILAMGGIENPRILLNSNIGNENDQVGRYFMNHPKGNCGVINLYSNRNSFSKYFGYLNQSHSQFTGLALPASLQEGRKILNSYARFLPVYPWSNNRGVESLIWLFKQSKVSIKKIIASDDKGLIMLRDYSETGDSNEIADQRLSIRTLLRSVFQVLTHLPSVFQYTYYRLIPCVTPSIRQIMLRNFMEMSPDPRNRVVLSKIKDAYDVPIPHIYYKTSEIDKRTIVELHSVLAKEIERMGVGQLDKEDISLITGDSSHHMGTTRMGVDPKTSVVDVNCKVHTMDNVYIAGSSVFTTGSCVNPTFTIVALSIRLADHIEKYR